MGKEKNFGYLGQKFQLSLLNILITDKKFSKSVIDTIDAKYFDNNYYRLVVNLIKDFYKKYDSIPSFEVLEQQVATEIPEVARLIVTDTLKNVEVMELDGGEAMFQKEKALKFCKQQELAKALKKVQELITNGDFENYDKSEEIIRKALQVGIEDDGDGADVFDNLEDVLSQDFRHAIPTGIDGIDTALSGGLGKGELGVILAPTGVGKSTITTKFANTAYKAGYNVLHIFFEDQKKQIQRKHICGITGISPNEQHQRVDEVKKLINEFKEKNKGKLVLRKYPSETLTFIDIKNKILKIIAEGTKFDLLIIDYVDCIISGGVEYENEGSLMRKIEALGTELDVAIWVATQGNRSSISSDVVTTDQMGGSIKKAQVGHVIITIAKTLQQKESKMATIAITKSRIGPDGIVFNNCKFDNEMLSIDTTTVNSVLGFEEHKEQERRNNNQKNIERALQGRL